MGTKQSIDKNVSDIEDILSMNPSYFRKIKFENKSPMMISHHLKLWKFSEDLQNNKKFCTEPISLQQIKNTGFTFKKHECYIVQLIYRSGSCDEEVLESLPSSMWGLVESYSNQTPRGLEVPVASSVGLANLNREVMDSFIVPKSNKEKGSNKAKDSEKLEYMIFVWNGKHTKSILQSHTISRAFEQEDFIQRSEGPFQEVLFSGGVFKNNKLRTGSILQLISNRTRSNSDSRQSQNEMRNTVYLFRFLFPRKGGVASGIQLSLLQNFKGFNEISIPIPETNIDDSLQPLSTSRSRRKIKDIDEKSDSFRKSDIYEKNKNKSKKTSDITLKSPRDIEEIKSNEVKNKLNFEITPNNNKEVNKKKVPFVGPQNINKIKGMEFMDKNKKINYSDRPSSDRPSSDDHDFDFDGITPRSYDPANDNLYDKDRENYEFKKNQDYQDYQDMDEDDIGEIEDLEAEMLDQVKDPPKFNIPIYRIPKFDDREQIDIDDIQKAEKAGDYGNIRPTQRSDIKIQYYSQKCSEIIPNFLYLGGQIVAYNYKLMKSIGITHILNCAGDYCESKFPEHFTYKTYFLKDCKTENIEAVFYDAIKFQKSIREKNGKVFVHCVKGVSRSVTQCMAYLIFTEKMTYDDSFSYIREKRGVASPNIGFVVQLMMFYQRLYEPYHKFSIKPKIFSIGSHQQEDPRRIVARLISGEKLYSGKNMLTLDSRGVFIIQDYAQVYIWIGEEIYPGNKDRFINHAKEYVKLLQTYENASVQVSQIYQNEEPLSFWKIFQVKSLPNQRYTHNQAWNKWYMPIEDSLRSARSNKSRQAYAESDEQEERPALYSYPNYIESQKIFFYDDLDDEEQYLLCIKEFNRAYIWKGIGFKPKDEMDVQEFIKCGLQHFFDVIETDDIEVIIENPGEESDNFTSYFN